MPISDAREHLGEVVGRARYGGEYQLPPEIMAQVEESRRHPERDRPRPRRASRSTR